MSNAKGVYQGRPMVLTMGDPVGVGPEIIAAALCDRPEAMGERLVVAGDWETMQVAAQVVAHSRSIETPLLECIESLGDWRPVPGRLAVVQACTPGGLLPKGRVSELAGRAAAACIQWAAQAALSGAVRAIVTGPIHKEALAAAGFEHPGHTEYLQALAAAHRGVHVGDMPVRMMLSCPGLRTVLVSIHVSLQDALRAVTHEQVLQTIRIAGAHFRRCGLPQVRIGVAGLNPHAGEGGLFGREEIEVIGPAIAVAKQEGLEVSGPHAPDTVFMRARQGEFDVVIAMYHDQGLIPVKLLGLDDGVNTTLGLPFVRTSPDHGTAFDLAGTGKASPSSLLAAIDAAWDMSA